MGVGFYIGKEVIIIFKFVFVDYGYVFVRVDLEGNLIIEVDVNYVVNM